MLLESRGRLGSERGLQGTGEPTHAFPTAPRLPGASPGKKGPFPAEEGKKKDTRKEMARRDLTLSVFPTRE